MQSQSSEEACASRCRCLAPFARTVLLLMLVAGIALPSRAQYSIDDYAFSTGPTDSVWINLSSSTIRTQFNGDPLNIGFDFLFMGNYYSQYAIGAHGELVLGPGTLDAGSPTPAPYVGIWPIDRPIITPFGRNLVMGPDSRIEYGIKGPAGHRVLVVNAYLSISGTTNAAYIHQTQLHECDGAIVFVYRSTSNPELARAQIGFAADTATIHRAVQISHTHEFGSSYDVINLVWPGTRYYRFAPQDNTFCPMAHNLRVLLPESNSVTLTWDPTPHATTYRISYYAPHDSAATAGVRYTSRQSYVLTDLELGASYVFQVRAVCPNSDQSIPISGEATIPCYHYINNPVQYTNLAAPNVTCRTGAFSAPSAQIQRVDYGPSDRSSRHTVHTDTSEYDQMSGYALKVIPDGSCRVVRLGDYCPGGLQEDITYELTVDTVDYDLLILHYALVEEDPQHPIESQPKFILSVMDSAGNLLNACYQRNFVSGVDSWNEGRSAQVLWHDWDAMGVDLTAYHGQRILVNISNYDCSYGGHMGYAYFMLEGTTKHLKASHCGSVGTNTFTAPKGFTYRWYKDTAPNVTLSTNRSLTVTDSGTYYCRASFIGSGTNCGFTMQATAGGRYPVAGFTYEPLSICNHQIHFFNESLVASDPEHFNIINEQCDSITWIFDDGETSTRNSPIHTFSPGDHAVLLVASLAGGQCNDTASLDFHVDIIPDTTTVSICPGTTYPFHDQDLVEPGYYFSDSGCYRQVVRLLHYPTSVDTLYDTICQGGIYHFDTCEFTGQGWHLASLPDIHGCDSLTHIHLHTFLYASSTQYDTICQGGSYSLGDTLINDSGTFLHPIPTYGGCDSLVTLHLTTPLRDSTFVARAICQGDSYLFGDHTLADSGTYRHTFTAVDGCDSLAVLQLSIRPYPNLRFSVDTVCNNIPHYRLLLSADTFGYSFASTPLDSCFAYTPGDATALLSPRSDTRYVIATHYLDEPYCPTVDTLLLDSLLTVRVKLKLHPDVLDRDQLNFDATDMGMNSISREWYVNGLLTGETGPRLIDTAPPDVDSVLVTLIGYSINCSDTAHGVIPVLRHELFFPSVFTPGLDNNNVFRPLGVNVYDYQLWIYDRRGDQVFHSASIDQGWDGTAHGHLLPQAVYVYTCRYTSPQGPQTVTGTVLLLR